MDKNAIKKYAIWARNELIARVIQKAEQYEITEKKITPKDADSINGRILTDAEKNQRKALIEKIQADGFEQVMEEVAYTWFNRFTALRFMEVNNYLPSHTRVFTNEAGEFKPQILTDAIQLDIDGLDMDKVYELKNESKTEELYKYLLITQCNALSRILPRMFQEIEDYTELLLPDYLLREGSAIEQMISMIPEDNFDVNTAGGQIEIIGWLYQYYISEKHEEVVDPLHGKVVKKEEVPAATQLFTTDWVVRYLIDNSVGRYWIERNPNSTLANNLTYFVKPKDGTIRVVDEIITPQEVTVFDPCVGSGHFLIYAFDVLMKIYIEYGYSERDAAIEIVKNNLFGLDIDGRASQLAYFSVMMKARQYDRRFFSRDIQPNIYEIMESNTADRLSIEYFHGNDTALKKDIEVLLDTLRDAKEYGSILQMPAIDYKIINKRFAELSEEISMYNTYLLSDFQSMIRPAEIMSRKYAIVATNPPYLNKYDPALRSYIMENYNDYKGDIFSVFIHRNFAFCLNNGYTSFMTPFVWMFIKTYSKLREEILKDKSITTLIQMEYSAFEEATVPICSFVLKNGIESELGKYFRLSAFTGGMEVQRKKVLEAINDPDCGYYFETSVKHFFNIPGMPLAYWVSDKFVEAFSNEQIAKYAISDGQTKTGDNGKYLRNVWEISAEKIGKDKKWALIAKGGYFRRWAGNIDTVIDWSQTAREHYKSDHVARIAPEYIWFRKGVCWNHITSGNLFAARYIDENMLFETAAPAIFFEDEEMLFYVIGYLNSPVSGLALRFINPTISTNVGDITSQPLIYEDKKKDEIITKVKTAISLSLLDWNAFETAWDFQSHPLVPMEYERQEQLDVGINHNERKNAVTLLSERYKQWEQECKLRFSELKDTEEELNSIFIDIYGLQDELKPDVDDKDVTVRMANLQRDIRSLISYAVGCMFGRYSLDVPGLVYAGGKWDASKYTTFQPDKDAIIPICDDEYFDDDILGRFVNYIKVVYGEETLEENLRFIADALGGKGTSRQVIRNYFINDFYADHLKIYQKRPIYWLFDSGNKNGFKCLVYMHRYKPDTIARIRTDYVHEQQSRYRTAIADLENRINGAGTSERVKLNKLLSSLQAQTTEIREYEERIHHLADQMISIDLDDGVKSNYEIFKDVLAKIK